MMILAGFSEGVFFFYQAWAEKGWNILPHNHLTEIKGATMETQERTVIAV